MEALHTVDALKVVRQVLVLGVIEHDAVSDVRVIHYGLRFLWKRDSDVSPYDIGQNCSVLGHGMYGT